MSLADELLSTVSDDISTYTAEFEEEPHIVIGNDRFIRVPEELKKIAVQYDHNVETVTFDCPRYWDGYDMSKMKIYINYTRSDGLIGMYVANNITTNRERPNIMHFDWTLTRNVTGINGPIVFMVCVKRVDSKGHEEIHWNSERNTEMYVSQALRGEEAVRDQYPDIYTQMLQRMDEIEDIMGTTQVEIEETITVAKNDIFNRADELESNVEARVSKFESDVTALINNHEIKVSSLMDEHRKTVAADIDDFKSKVNTRSSEVEAKMDETMEMVSRIEDLTSSEALRNYTAEYLEENPSVIQNAVADMSMASDGDIDTIIGGTYVETPSDIIGGGSSGGEEITDEDLDDIVGGLFT